MTHSVDLISQTWTVELFEACTLTVQPDGKIAFDEKPAPPAPYYTPKTQVGQAVANVYSSVTKWSGAVVDGAWPSASSLKSVVQAIILVVDKELGSAGDTQSSLNQAIDAAEKCARLTQTINRLSQLFKNVEAHDLYIKKYNEANFFLPERGVACPRHEHPLRRLRTIIAILQSDLKRYQAL